MSNSKSIQGRDAQIRLFRNGTPVEIVQILNFNYKEDADFKRSSYLGTTESIGDTNHQGWSGDFEVEVVGPQLDDLIDALVEENLGRIDVEEITLQYQENYRDNSKAAWIFSGVQLKYSNAAGSRDEKIRRKMEFQADRRKRVL